MELKKITKENFNTLYSFMENDFPLSERRTKQNQFNLLKNKNVSLNFIEKDEKTAGYFIFWNFEDFIFIEHIATLKEFRGQGIGTSFLKEFISKQNKQIILEVEKPDNETAIKRIRFYEHLGFVLNDYNYMQPSYHNDGAKVPMKIMTLQKTLSEQEYNKITQKIKQEVYNVKD